jgi:hypothetical protein
MVLAWLPITDLADSSVYFAAVYVVVQSSHCDNLIGENESKRKAVAIPVVNGGKLRFHPTQRKGSRSLDGTSPNKEVYLIVDDSWSNISYVQKLLNCIERSK